MKKDLLRTIQAGCLIEPDLPLFAETLDAFPGNGAISTYAPRIRPGSPWRSQLMEGWPLVSVVSHAPSGLRCALSSEGQVNLYGPGGQPDHTFQVPEAGVFGEAATGLGYVNRIRAVGDQLLVCGQSRQVWRFEWDGADLAGGRWVDFAGPMRQPPMPDPPDDAEGDALDRWLDENDAIDFVDIDGSGPADIYAIGDEAWHWNGRRWQPLALPTDEPLAAIQVIGRDDVLMAGHNGTLLRGNARSGFTDLSTVDDNQNFTGLAWFSGRLYLASNLGLFAWDPATRRITPQRTGLKPELQDTHQLEAKDGVLWSFGFKDLAYFDGRTWTRVHHPDNPRIGG